jgi:hypothetical protein
MATIAEIRQQYPQYNDLSDQQLADSFHDKFYKDIPKTDFYKQLGVALDAPKAEPKAEPKAAPKVAQKEDNSALGYLKKGAIAVDDAVRGAADTLTFGFADEISAGLNTPLIYGYKKLTGQDANLGQIYDEQVNAQRERDAEGGAARTVGQVAGALVPARRIAGMAEGALKLAKVAPTATKTAAATGAIQGGLYGVGAADGDATDRAIGGVLGATTGGVLGGVGGKVFDKATDMVPSLRADKLAQKPYAQIDAELTRDLAAIRNNATSGGDLIVKQRNALGNSYIDSVKADLKQAGIKLTPELNNAIKQRTIITQEGLDALRGTPGGDAVADTITKYQRLMEITKPEAASGSVSKVVRGVVDWSPLPKPVNQAIQSVLGSRVTAEQKMADLLKGSNVKASDILLEKLGPSAATQSGEKLSALAQANMANLAQNAATKVSGKAPPNPNQLISELQGKDPTYLLGLGNPLGAPRNATEMAEFSAVMKAQMQKRADEAAQKLAEQTAAKGASKASQELATRNQVLQETRMPLGGAFQELLPGGKAGTNMSSEEAIQALRLLSRKGGAVGDGAKQILKSPRELLNDDVFYGVQNALRKLQENGVVGGSPAVKNPEKYMAGAVANAIKEALAKEAK